MEPGCFNAVHGGDAHALIPAVFLHLFFVMHMLAGIVHRQLLRNYGASAALSLNAQVQSLKQMAYWRGNVARISIVLSPLIALALAQVLANAFYAIDLYASVRLELGFTALTTALLLCLVLSVRWRAGGTGFARPASNVISFGALKLSQRLLGHLSASLCGHLQPL